MRAVENAKITLRGELNSIEWKAHISILKWPT
jgi:hypothetical protein